MKQADYRLEVAMNSEPFARNEYAVIVRLNDGTGRALVKDMIPGYADTHDMKTNVYGVVLFLQSSKAVAMMEKL